jgi:hypothetical protein
MSKVRNSHDLANLVAQFVILSSRGDPATALSAVCEVASELIKVGGVKAPELRNTFVNSLDRFLKIPNSLIQSEGQTPPPKIIVPGN